MGGFTEDLIRTTIGDKFWVSLHSSDSKQITDENPKRINDFPIDRSQ